MRVGARHIDRKTRQGMTTHVAPDAGQNIYERRQSPTGPHPKHQLL